jgi:hypothetical protein
MTFWEILRFAADIALVVEAWTNRINTMNFGGIPRNERINRILKMLVRMATDPELDSIIRDNF